MPVSSALPQQIFSVINPMRIIVSYFFFACTAFFICCTPEDTGADKVSSDTLILSANQDTLLLAIHNDSVPVLKRPYTKQDTLQWAREDSLNKIHMARMIGLHNTCDTTNKLKFKKITAAEFAVFKKNYHNPIDTSIKRILHSKEGFSIKTADSLYYFKYDLDDFCYYNCFVKPLKLYMIYSGSGRNEISWMAAIDSLNNKYYYIEHTFDDGLMETRVSPGLKHIIWFNNDIYESFTNRSFISIIRIDPQDISYKYVDVLGHKSREWFIRDLVWVTDNSFALKVYEAKGQNTKLIGVQYLKATF
jgi:hypothetical protein